jgi:RNA polymerase sigma-70 factor, ECF subfamily
LQIPSFFLPPVSSGVTSKDYRGGRTTVNETARTTHELIERAGQGDEAARRELLELYRDHLRRMIAARLDRRLTSRVDASDVVQETLTDAAGQLDEYLRDQPLPFLLWLRQLAGVRIRKTHRRHLFAQSRSVTRETPAPDLCDESAVELGRQFLAHDTSPSNKVMRQELRDAVMEAVAALSPRDREVLLMRHIEKLGLAEIADTLGMGETGVKARLYRALTRLRAKLESEAHP